MSKSTSPILDALYNVAETKDIPVEMVVETLQAALAAAYRKDFAEPDQNIRVEFDINTGSSRVYDVKQVVEDVNEEELEDLPQKERKLIYSPKMHVMLSDAKKIRKDIEVGELIKTELEVPEAYGRMAAQTAKQVIIQKLKEAERNTIFQEFKDKEGLLMIGTVQRIEGRNVLVDVGKTIGIIPTEQQIPNEKYHSGDKIKVYVAAVEMGARGPEIILSRSHPELIKKLFNNEIPEVSNGTIEIKSVAREAGHRSKVAVLATDPNIDPIGSCVGQRGARVQTIINELNGEKIDIIEYSENPVVFITNALSPAKVMRMEINEETKEAMVVVASDQLSLAIGRAGQNVRLAAKLTGWKINIKGDNGEAVAVEEVQDEAAETDETPSEEKIETTEAPEEATEAQAEEEAPSEK